MAKESDSGAAELTLGGLGIELVVLQCLQDHEHMHQMLLARFREDEDVVAIDFHNAPQHGRGRASLPWAHQPGQVEG